MTAKYIKIVKQLVTEAKRVDRKSVLSVESYVFQIEEYSEGMLSNDIANCIASYKEYRIVSANYLVSIFKNRQERIKQLKEREHRILGGVPSEDY